MAIKLTQSQLRYLKKQGHHLKPLVIIGNAGLSDSVLQEIEVTVAHHELIKIRVNADDKSARQLIAEKICQKIDASLVLSIGHVIAIYRPAQNPGITLPKN